MLKMFNVTKQDYEDAVKRAKENLKGEDLEKCLQALKNFMKFVKE